MIDSIVKQTVENKMRNINTCLICQAESADKVISPDGSILEVLKLDGLEFSAGDNVVVVFSQQATDGVGNRQFDISDGIVIGKLG